MIPRLAEPHAAHARGHGNAGDPRLESLAAEFALLAQRRSRAVHQTGDRWTSSAPLPRSASPSCRSASTG